MELNSEGLKFICAEVKNFKGIKSKFVQIDGRSLVIIGGNATNKSSMIDVMKSSLSKSYIPAKPILDGEEEAIISVKLDGEIRGEKKEYDIHLSFTQKHQRGAFSLKSNGAKVTESPKSVLDAAIGNVALDVFDFVSWEAEDQIEVIKALSRKKVELDAIEAKIDELFKQRTFQNTKNKEQKAVVKNHGYTKEEVAKYTKAEDIEPIRKELADLQPAIERYAAAENLKKTLEEKRDDLQKEQDGIPDKKIESDKRLKEHEDEIAALRLKIQGLEIKMHEEKQAKAVLVSREAEIVTEKESLQKRLEGAEEFFKNNEKPDAEKINGRLSDAEKHNEHYKILQEYMDKQRDLRKGEELSESYTKQIEALEKEHRIIIEQSPIPVQGLTYKRGEKAKDNMVLYNNLPFKKGQVNTAEIIKVCARVAMALNPNLKVIFVQDGSLLDKNSLKWLVDTCHAEGYQLIIEIVDFFGGDMEIMFVEDFLENIKAVGLKEAVKNTSSEVA